MTISAMGRKLIRDVGLPEDIRQDLKTFRRDVNLLANQRRELTKQYPNKWVAFYNGKVELMADTLNDLLIMVDREEIPRDKTITQYLGTKKITMVL